MNNGQNLEATAKLDALIDIVDRHVRDDKRHN
jgi:hypothetical protein